MAVCLGVQIGSAARTGAKPNLPQEREISPFLITIDELSQRFVTVKNMIFPITLNTPSLVSYFLEEP
jgi:hypothetical protein